MLAFWFTLALLMGCSRKALQTGSGDTGLGSVAVTAASNAPSDSSSKEPAASRGDPKAPDPQRVAGLATPKKIPGRPIDDGHTVGSPKVFGNLAVFPIRASTQEDIGEFTTLDEALEKGTAVVRELEPAADTAPHAEQQAEPPQNDPIPLPVQARASQTQTQRPRHHHRHYGNVSGDGAQVNTLIIENNGDLPILVLAGTIVKGGKQDRQIGQDFLVAARTQAPVDAFCVERGRWTGIRSGESTEGKFSTMKMLASSKVREAGQYKRDQGEVWSKVGEVNRAHQTQTPSETLVAAVEHGDVARERQTLAASASAWLRQVEAVEDVVGFAYAVDGQVRGVRFFMNRKLFLLFEDALIGTAAQDALTAAQEARAEKRPVASGQTNEEAVERFIHNVAAAEARSEPTRAGHLNSYQVSDEGYGSTVLAPPAPAAPLAKPKAITRDYLAK
ncbi:ARPP-1 family domain-containing protein [Chondromyces crocatus]|uniref:ARPP-1 family domain-containing protein n=1 Tax=Chondromyces crocatus TaxID=52 RepID=UPI00067CE874|nr:DUF6569 family protein [Chondromyces crocatus]